MSWWRPMVRVSRGDDLNPPGFAVHWLGVSVWSNWGYWCLGVSAHYDRWCGGVWVQADLPWVHFRVTIWPGALF